MNILVRLTRFEPGAFGVVLQCTNHYTNHAIIINTCTQRPLTQRNDLRMQIFSFSTLFKKQ